MPGRSENEPHSSIYCNSYRNFWNDWSIRMSCPVRVTATFQKQAYGVEVTFSLQQNSEHSVTVHTSRRHKKANDVDFMLRGIMSFTVGFFKDLCQWDPNASATCFIRLSPSFWRIKTRQLIPLQRASTLSLLRKDTACACFRL